jgi:hypothetical protein
MPHPVGERLRCDECGAEIVFEKGCSCPEREPKEHYDFCCGKQMRSIGIVSRLQVSEAVPGEAGR